MALTPGQQKCVEVLDAPLAVSAGAGSGKTFTLTRRIVHALECGYLDDIDQVLAITFTSKAAGEIKSRVKGALRAQGMADQALKVDGAWISTIHGMCSRILRAHALELGIDPEFDIADEASSDALLDAALDEVLGGRDDLVNVADGLDAKRLDALFSEFTGRSVRGSASASVEDMVRTLVKTASASPDGMGCIVRPPASPSPIALLEQACEVAGEAAALAEQVKPGSRRDDFLDTTGKAIERARDILEDEAAAKALTYKKLLELLNAFAIPGLGFGKKMPYGQQAPDLANQLLGICAEARCAWASPLLDTLVDLAGLTLASFERRKRAAGLLGNDDLLTLAYKALLDHPAIARTYENRFKLVMIDEFQDTDQLQVDMIKRLAGEGFSRLCTVGDAQQSIYRFRGADVSVYRRHLADVEQGNPDGLIELPDNFRSHRDVLALCDRIFEQPGVFGAQFMSLAPGRDEARVARPFRSEGSRVRVQVICKPYKGVSTDEAVAAAAGRIADEFASLAREGMSPGDMVVLLGGMTRADVYAEALRAHGLACVVDGGSIFNRAPEVSLMVRLAQAVTNPKWTAALFEVISSELFALSADDLLVLSTSRHPDLGILRRRSLDQGFRSLEKAVAAGREVSGALRNAALVMRRAQDQLASVALSRILEDVVATSGWLSRLQAAGPEGLARAANVYKVIRMAREIEAEGGMGPAGVANRLARRVEVAREAPGALSAGGGDFVRIMTVHASKGLEFPVVAVAELRDDSARASALSICNVKGKTYVSLDGGTTLSRLAEKSSCPLAKAKAYQPFSEYDEDELAAAVQGAATPALMRAAARLHEERGEAAEARRLLYVALTRAKECLVISMRGTTTKDDPTGLSKGCWGDVESALAGLGQTFEPGVSGFPFGGERPARVECVMLSPDAADDGAADVQPAGEGEGAADASAPDASSQGCASALFDIVSVPPVQSERGRALPSARADVFSYSSISGDHAPVQDATVAFALDGGVDLPAGDDTLGDAEGARGHAFADDSDKATDFGSAFHRVAQAAACIWEPGGALTCPPKERCVAIAHACGLSSESFDRLTAACDRWFSSDLAARASACARLRAEVPFMLRMGEEASEGYLEGEIDLLAETDEPGVLGAPAGSALVIDYKTGGSADEAAEQLREKHLLQATCYAAAVLSQGYDQVECVFVRVEQASEVDAAQPQQLSYRFAARDFAEIMSAVADVRARALCSEPAGAHAGHTGKARQS